MGPSLDDVGRASTWRAASGAPHYVFSSHDGYGLGHVRRNTLIAQAILDVDPDAKITLVTGVRVKPAWLADPNIDVVHVPPLLKDPHGAYRHESLPFEEAIAVRADVFARTIEATQPDVVIVDRHPFGVGSELRAGLGRARALGSRIVLGLRDILDEPAAVRAELSGEGWRGVTDVYDEIVVYGEPVLCNHDQEYELARFGIDVPLRYCGWVVEAAKAIERDERLLAVTAGGGGDGAEVFRLGLELAQLLPGHRAVLVAGPYAHRLPEIDSLDSAVRARIELRADTPGCGELFAAAGAVVQMAGYNSTFESLAAGVRPVLVPRRSPRREQAIRAARLAAMGVADMVDEGAPADEVAWLLRRPRLLTAVQLADAGIRLDGAQRAAQRLRSLALAPAGAR